MHFHYFSFSGAFVVDAAKVQHTVYNHAHKFLIISTFEEFGIALNLSLIHISEPTRR